MPRGRSPEAQEQEKLERGKGNEIEQQDWAEGELKEKVTEALEGAGLQVSEDGAVTAPEQSHLPTMQPTLVDKLDAAIRQREDTIGAIQDKQFKANVKWDAEAAYLRRDAETLRLAREQVLDEIKRWPVNPKDGDVRIVIDGDQERVWTFHLRSGWSMDDSATS